MKSFKQREKWTDTQIWPPYEEGIDSEVKRGRVHIVAQQVKKPTNMHEGVGLIPGLTQ